MKNLALAFVLILGLTAGLTSFADAAAPSAAPPAELSLQAAKITPVDANWTASLPRDPEAATEMYMQRIPAPAVQRANAYFEGGYWLQLWNFLFSMLVIWIFLSSGFAARLRDKVEARVKSKALQLIGFVGLYILISEVVSLPLDIYAGFFRERQYGLVNQTFASWFGEHLISQGIGLVIGTLLIAALYGVIRKVPRTWPVWGTAVTIVMMSIMMLLGPIYIDPLFNTYKPLENSEVRTSILSMAAANGVPAKEVYEFDASRQSDRISANVSGFLNTMSIRLNDNLLKRTTLPEIKAVMGHEMGHYVLHHIYKAMLAFSLVIYFGFAFVSWGFEGLRARFQSQWKIRSISDMAGLPLLAALISIYMFVMTPINNTLVRTEEAEADLFGLNTAGEPDADAEIDLKLTEYRKPDPSPLEEFIFFDHPGTRNRIRMAMRWKAEKINPPKMDSPPKN